MTEQRVSPLGDNVLDNGKIGGGDDLGVYNKIVPAHSKDNMLATHLEGLELPYVFLQERPGFQAVQQNRQYAGLV